MGTDVHYTVEQFDEKTESWIMINEEIGNFGNRNYRLFNELANVRSQGERNNDPKGPPSDISRGSEMELEHWGSDAHSITWFEITELIEILKEQAFNLTEVAGLKLQNPKGLTSVEKEILQKYKYFDYHTFNLIDERPHCNFKYRVIIFFDN